MIYESKELSSMGLAILLDKLQEHKIALQKLDENEDDIKMNKILVLKSQNVKDNKLEGEDCQSVSDEYMYLIFLKFKEFLTYKKMLPNFKKQNIKRSTFILTFFKCRMKWHIKLECEKNQRTYRK